MVESANGDNNATIVDTPEGISRYQALVVIQGLKACKVGMRLNTAYTPKNLRAMATRITGLQFKARDYDGMIAAIQAKIGEGG